MLKKRKYDAIALLLKLLCVNSVRHHAEHITTPACQLPDTDPLGNPAPALIAYVFMGQIQITFPTN